MFDYKVRVPDVTVTEVPDHIYEFTRRPPERNIENPRNPLRTPQIVQEPEPETHVPQRGIGFQVED